MKEVYVTKASAVGEHLVESVRIDIIGELNVNDRSSIKVLDEVYDHDSDIVVAALSQSLPGGTLDRVMAKLFQKRMSHFVIPLFNEGE